MPASIARCPKESDFLNIAKQRKVQMCLKTIKGIRDAASTADFRIRFEILKFKNLKI